MTFRAEYCGIGSTLKTRRSADGRPRPRQRVFIESCICGQLDSLTGRLCEVASQKMIKVVHFANEQELRRLPWLAKQLLAVQAACPPTIMAHNLMAADMTVLLLRWRSNSLR